VPVEQALNSALIKHNSERALMKALRQEIVEEVNAFLYQQMHPIPNEARFKLVRERREVYSAMRQVIQSSQREIAFVITANGLYQWAATASSTTAPHAPRMALMCAASSPPT
jgi:hypothetical protein